VSDERRDLAIRAPELIRHVKWVMPFSMVMCDLHYLVGEE
jgi:hypothetical protein